MANVINKNTLQYIESVDTSNYLNGDWIINPSLPLCDTKYWKVDGETVVEMNDAEKDTITVLELDKEKQLAMTRIDEKTCSILAKGVTFNGNVFSLSLAAQSNWIGLQVAVSQGLLTQDMFPFTISTVNNGEYSLTWAEKDAFFATILNKITVTLASGRSLKNQISSATTVAGVQQVVDNRV